MGISPIESESILCRGCRKCPKNVARSVWGFPRQLWGGQCGNHIGWRAEETVDDEASKCEKMVRLLKRTEKNRKEKITGYLTECWALSSALFHIMWFYSSLYLSLLCIIYNPVSYTTLRVRQMILVYRNENEFCHVEMQLIPHILQPQST